MAEKMENIIQTSHLTKRYGAKIAVNDLNLSIRKGEVFGLLGPNGAGKTTTILMLLGLTEPTAGERLSRAVTAREIRWKSNRLSVICRIMSDFIQI